MCEELGYSCIMNFSNNYTAVRWNKAAPANHNHTPKTSCIVHNRTSGLSAYRYKAHIHAEPVCVDGRFLQCICPSRLLSLPLPPQGVRRRDDLRWASAPARHPAGPTWHFTHGQGNDTAWALIVTGSPSGFTDRGRVRLSKWIWVTVGSLCLVQPLEPGRVSLSGAQNACIMFNQACLTCWGDVKPFDM